jgi:hypothetical protein
MKHARAKLLVLVAVFVFFFGCNMKSKETVENNTIIVQIEHTEICLIIYQVGHGVGMMRVGCNEVSNPVVVPLNQLPKRNGL